MSKVFDELIDSKVRFRTYEGEYEGIVESISLQMKRITFEQVYLLPNRKYLDKMHFFFYEFLSYVILDSGDEHKEFRKKECLMLNCSDSKSTSVLYNDNYLDQPLKSGECVGHEDSNFKELVLKLPPNLQKVLPNDFVVLDAFDSEFQQSVSYISQQSIIGVSFEGPEISRNGKLSWVCISTAICVFLFDVITLGKAVIDKGLRNIFQSKKIAKVIHDCRQPSDCLFHMFSIELVNVFDTQVADFIVKKQMCSDGYTLKSVNSLDCCIQNYLAVPKKFLYSRQRNTYYYDKIFHDKRPIDNECCNILIKNALYLLLLREHLMKLLMKPVYDTTNVYLKVLTDSSESDLRLKPSVPNMIPPALLNQGLQIIRFQSDSVKAPAPATPKFKHKQNENKTFQTYSNSFLTKHFNDMCLDKSNIHLNKEIEKLNEAKCTNFQNKSETFLNESRKSSSVDKRKSKNYKKVNTQARFNKSSNCTHDLQKSENKFYMKPSDNLVSNSDITKLHSESSRKEKASKIQLDVGSHESFKYHFQNSTPVLRENSGTTVSGTSTKLHSTFGINNGSSNKSANLQSKKKILIVPSGMCC